MKHRWLWLLGASTAAYAAWRLSLRKPPPPPGDLFLLESEAYGHDRGRGNLVAMQPWMLPIDYSTEAAFAKKLGGYLEETKALGWLSSRSLVVLPAQIGTFLVVAGEMRSVYATRTFEDAAARTIARNLPRYLAGLFPLDDSDPFSAALFRAKGARVAAIYSRVLSELARAYDVTIVGGSVLLPAPSLDDGVVHAGKGPLREVCAVFGPDGRAFAPLAVKATLDPDERGFVAPGDVRDAPVFETPAGRLGVLVGRDAFQPGAYDALRERGAELLAVPAYLPGEAAWTSAWPGYLGLEVPEDVSPLDERGIVESEAWRRYGLGGRAGRAGARSGVAAFFRGALWDRGTDGAALLVDGETCEEGPLVAGGTVSCLWL